PSTNAVTSTACPSCTETASSRATRSAGNSRSSRNCRISASPSAPASGRASEKTRATQGGPGSWSKRKTPPSSVSTLLTWMPYAASRCAGSRSMPLRLYSRAVSACALSGATAARTGELAAVLQHHDGGVARNLALGDVQARLGRLGLDAHLLQEA